MLFIYKTAFLPMNMKKKETSVEEGEKCEQWIISAPLNYVSKYFSSIKVARA